MRVALFEVRGLTRTPWFSGFDLTVEAGEVVVLSGPTGSGKTLLLRALADLDPVEAGEVSLEGRERGTLAPAAWRSQVVYLHQDAVRLPGTVRDNLACIARMELHRSKSVPPVPGLDPDADVARLSGGEAQRLAMHRALAVQPAVLLLDESTSALDGDSAREAERRILEWVAEGHGALWVSHDPSMRGRLGAREVTLP